MGLSRTQFDLMTNLEAAGSRTPTQRELAAASGRSVGTVNKTLKELQELGYVQKNQLTPQGLAALEPYRAKRAVFVAAGFGSRMVPITLNTPKPLVRVNGTRMIDTLLDAVVSDNIFPSPDEAKVYLTGLAETVPSISNVKAYAEIVQEKYLIRQLMGVATGILEDAGDEPDASLLLENAEQRLYEIRSGRDSSALTPLSSSMVETLTNLQKISGPDADKYKGIPTGFRLLDTVLTGLGRGDLIILAARPGMGKSSFALNIATRVAMKQHIPVAIFSLEMTKEQLTNRILSAEAGIDSQAFRTGALTASDWEYLALATEKLHDAPIYMDDTSAITITEMKAKIRRINQDPGRPNIGLIVIDYLQLMTSGQRSENRVQEISSITRNLKIMAKEMDVPIIALSQLSRAVEKQGNNSSHRPQLSDLRDSGAIEQDADVVMFLHREEYYDPNTEDKNIAEVIVAKQRNGPLGTIKLAWLGQYTRFASLQQT